MCTPPPASTPSTTACCSTGPSLGGCSTSSSSPGTRSARRIFVDSSHEWTEEQLHYLPPLDLGPRDAHEWQSNDELFVPLFDKRREIIGVLDLFDPRDRQIPSLELVKSLEVFAAQAAMAIENARQYKALEDATAQLAAQLELRHGLIELSAALLTTLDQRELFARVAALLKDFVDYDAMEIRLVDEATHELYCGFASERGSWPR